MRQRGGGGAEPLPSLAGLLVSAARQYPAISLTGLDSFWAVHGLAWTGLVNQPYNPALLENSAEVATRVEPSMPVYYR